MLFLVTKYAITALIIVVVTEVAKRSDRIGALISSLPLVTVMVMFWLFLEKQGTEKIANHALYTFWFVIPTLPMFSAYTLSTEERRRIWSESPGRRTINLCLLRNHSMDRKAIRYFAFLTSIDLMNTGSN